ncbi:MAG TPA: hypothetical protein VMX94_00540 [Armatimonadota bacterium]|nr:hypothetical protein [Armatimonadota bacterium]
MSTINQDELRAALDMAINGKLVVQNWLGYANVLFLGFGDEVLPRVPAGESPAWSPYELETNYADWSVENEKGIVGTADDERAKALAAVELLVGHRATGWAFGDTLFCLVVYFEGGFKLKITPMADALTDEEILRRNGGFGSDN